MKVVIDNKVIYADGYIAIPSEKAIQFYIENHFCGFAPINVDGEMLSDFGRKVLLGKSEVRI